MSHVNAVSLHYASQKGHHDLVQRLLEAGADANVAMIPNVHGPLWTASLGGHLNVVKTLLAGGANVNQADKNTVTPLFMASQEGHHDVVQSLLEAGADANVARTVDGRSPLSIACFNGHLKVVKVLLEAGCNVNQVTKDGKTALDIAVHKGYKDIIEVLKMHQSKVQILEEKASKPEQDTMDTKQQNDALQQQIRLEVQQTEERAIRAEERAIRAEKELLETRQQSDALQMQIHQAEERATIAEQELLKTSQQKDELQQQIRLQDQQAKERATILEEELLRERQQNDTLQQQIRLQVQRAEERERDIQINPLWRVNPDEIEELKGCPLGLGGWGEVRVATFHGIRVAATFIILPIFNMELFIREINIAASVRHPNILLFIGAFWDDDKIVILTEFMEVSLRSIIGGYGTTFTRGHVITIGTDVARGLNYLHLMRPDPIIHRDISSSNVLLEPIGLDKWKAKIGDFGSANFLSKVLTPCPGNVTYSAPESSNPKMQSPKMDVYSYGVLLLEMATGKFPDYSIREILLNTLSWKEMKVVIKRCTCDDPVNRPTMKDILCELPQLNMHEFRF